MASTAAAEATGATDDDCPSANDTQIVNDTDGSSPKRAKLDEEESSTVKRTRSTSKSKRSDAVMMEEAKAAFGDLDTSEGRRLRKRSSEPAKEEKDKKQTPRRSSRRKSSTKAAEPEEEEEEEETAEEMHLPEKNGSDEKPVNISATTDGIVENKPEEEIIKSAADKSENSNGIETKAVEDGKSEDSEKAAEESKDDQTPVECVGEKPSEEISTSD